MKSYSGLKLLFYYFVYIFRILYGLNILFSIPIMTIKSNAYSYTHSLHTKYV